MRSSYTQTLAKDGTAVMKVEFVPKVLTVRVVAILSVEIPNGSKHWSSKIPMGRLYVVILIDIRSL